MAVLGRGRFLHSAAWAGAGLLVALAGLFMSLHENAAHDACVGLAQGLRRGIVQTGLNCGFTDTVYWAGIVILIAGALSTIATAGAAVSSATRSGRASDRSNLRVKGRQLKGQTGFEHAVDPTDPVTRWKLDPATNWRPGPAGWHAGPSVAEPFVPPVRHSDDPEPPSFPRSSALGEDIVITALPPPAWYSDPDRGDAIRWWDGESWGESRPNST